MSLVIAPLPLPTPSAPILLVSLLLLMLLLLILLLVLILVLLLLARYWRSLLVSQPHDRGLQRSASVQSTDAQRSLPPKTRLMPDVGAMHTHGFFASAPMVGSMSLKTGRRNHTKKTKKNKKSVMSKEKKQQGTCSYHNHAALKEKESSTL